VENGCLKIVIEEWLAGILRVEEGDTVVISSANGKFGIWASRAVNKTERSDPVPNEMASNR